MTIEQALSALQGASDPKTAAAHTPGAAGNNVYQAQAAVSASAQNLQKVAGAPGLQQGSAQVDADVLLKIASRIAAAEEQAIVAEGSALGAAIFDGFMKAAGSTIHAVDQHAPQYRPARQQTIDDVAYKVASASAADAWDVIDALQPPARQQTIDDVAYKVASASAADAWQALDALGAPSESRAYQMKVAAAERQEFSEGLVSGLDKVAEFCAAAFEQGNELAAAALAPR